MALIAVLMAMSRLVCGNPACSLGAEWGDWSRPHGFCCWACRKEFKDGTGETAHGKNCFHRGVGFLSRRSKPDDVYEEDDQSWANSFKRCLSWACLACRGTSMHVNSDEDSSEDSEDSA